MSDGAIIETYFKAWDEHDIPAILATFNEGGSYTDPATDGPLVGEANAKYAQGLYDALPDLRIELLSNQQADNGMWVAPWIIKATKQDGNKVEIWGCDFIKLSNGKIDSVYGVFNPAQLG